MAWAAALMLAVGLGGCALQKTPDRASPAVVPSDPHDANASAANAPVSSEEALARGLKAWQTSTEAAVAVRWFRRAAMRRNAAAAYYLGIAYAEGRGVGGNPAKARFWLRRSANLGDAEAEYFVGLGFTNGSDPGSGDSLSANRNDAWAARWYGKAAAQGNVAGEYMLGLSYALGFGLPKDAESAYKWLWLAARAKYGPAETTLRVLTPKLGAADRARAIARARAWHPIWRYTFADGATVRFVQVVLTRLGFDPGKIDGKFGPHTAAAIAAYEASRGVDGPGHLTSTLLIQLKNSADHPKSETGL
jgi:hypothetical protein